MKLKSLVSAALLLFVAASLIVLLLQEYNAPPEPLAAASATAMSPPLPAPPAGAALQVAPAPAPTKIVAYYFHGDVRCQTCRTIEAFTREAIETQFAAELKDGRLEWRVVNLDQPGNEHYIEEFQLATRSVVLEQVLAGKRQAWKNLDRVWELVRGDKQEFLRYIQDQTRTYLAVPAP